MTKLYTDQPQVSIALCTYNGAQYLTQQLDTLVNQTYVNIEIIAVDDCSTDDTFNILSEYAKKHPQFKLFKNETNLGFTANFERALKLCIGELIALCDQDDIWHPEKISLQVSAIKDNVLVFHDSEFINEDGTKMNKKVSDIMNFYRGGNPEVFLFFNSISGHSILMKSALVAEALPLKAGYFHDWWLAYVATNIGTIDYVPECLVQYRQHANNDTNILRLKSKTAKHTSSAADKIQHIHQWLGYCSAFPKNKNQHLLDQIYQAYTKRINSYVSFELSWLLFKYRRTIFFIRKKSKLNMLNYIYSQVWGVKVKKLFSKKFVDSMDNLSFYKDQGLISIIIVTLNVQNVLQNCLNSIYKQQYPLLEIVIIDGGSTDGTLDILKLNDDKITLWKSEKDEGIYYAMNKALEYITGNWVYFLGADDILFDDFSLLAYQLKDKSKIYYANVLMNGNKFRGKVSSYQHSKSAICHQAIIYPKSVFDKYRFNTRYRISADHELNMRCWKDKNFTFEYIDLIIANFNHTGVSSLNVDQILEKDKPRLILKNHGLFNWVRYSFRQLKGALFPKRRKKGDVLTEQ